MTTPIERAAQRIASQKNTAVAGYVARAAFETIDRDELVRVVDESWPYTPEHIADAILEWLTQ